MLDGPDYKSINREAWTRLALAGCESSRPFGAREFALARRMLDPRGRLPWDEVRSVLCLAAAGGQQAPLFASLGYEVVSADLCNEQLSCDRRAALRYGLAIECLECDMLDLSVLYGTRFDLVFQAVSTCYVPDVRKVYREVRRVLRRGGLYWAQHWNPLQLQLCDESPWNGHAYQIGRPLQRGVPVMWKPDNEHEPSCVHFIHTLTDLLGGLPEFGFSILDFDEGRYGADANSEPGSHSHLAAYIPPFFSILSRASTEMEQ